MHITWALRYLFRLNLVGIDFASLKKALSKILFCFDSLHVTTAVNLEDACCQNTRSPTVALSVDSNYFINRVYTVYVGYDTIGWNIP